MKWFKFNLFLGVLWTSCYCTASGESQTALVSVEVGSDATLPCHIDQPDGDVNKMAVEWTGRPAADPREERHVHLFKDGRDVFGRDYPHPSYRTRASLSHERLSRGDFSLRLLRVRFSDEGTFRCFDPHLRVAREVRLCVVNMSPPKISPNGPADRGLSLTCDSGCWFPQPEVSWLDGDGNNISAGVPVRQNHSEHCHTVQSNVTVRTAGQVTCRVHLSHIDLTAETRHVISESDIPEESGNTAAIVGGIVGGIVPTVVIILFTTAVLSHRHYAQTLKTTEIQLKSILKTKFGRLSEWITDQGLTTAALGDIFIELCVTPEGSGEKTAIQRQDIFKDGKHRTVMTTGVAGIGKTVLAQKYILEWAENQFDDIRFVFPFTFRDKPLEKLKNTVHSMVELVNFFVDGINVDKAAICSRKVLFILDGLDHFLDRFSLDFKNYRKWTNVTERTSVERLLTNLIVGELLPRARIWIITRPAAANKIRSECDRVRVTTVTGFTDAQRDAFFKKTFRDDENKTREETSLTSYIKASESLHFMCHMPVFCWTVAKVLRDSEQSPKNQALPKTTAMYIHFMVVQLQHNNNNNNRHHPRAQAPPQAPDQAILSLGKLAFERLDDPTPIREADLAEFGIDRDAAVYSMLQEETTAETKAKTNSFSFVHQSAQGFLAALYAFVSFIRDGADLLSEPQTPSVPSDVGRFLQRAVDKALQSPNGHCGHWFLRFLLGLSLEANQRLLQKRLVPIQPGSTSQANQETNGNAESLLVDTKQKTVKYTNGKNHSAESIPLLETSQENVRYTNGNVSENHSAESISAAYDGHQTGWSVTNQKTIEYIKTKIRENLSPEKRINLLHCLNEMNDPSLVEEVQQYLSSGLLFTHKLSLDEQSDLKFILLSRRILDSSPQNTVTLDGTVYPGISQT